MNNFLLAKSKIWGGNVSCQEENYLVRRAKLNVHKRTSHLHSDKSILERIPVYLRVCLRLID